MGSDKARVTYDESRQYRSVVMQQGRVTVEADWNEEGQIVQAEQRKEVLDIVGTHGTPDNGYLPLEVPQTSGFQYDFKVDKGTMYVGGVRVALAEQVQYSQQEEWLDHTDDPNWLDSDAVVASPLPNEYILLYLHEHEVSAVEDSALREVALGGPDTAQRLRILQHIARMETDATDCATAMNQAKCTWTKQGLNFNEHTMRLQSAATLQVSFNGTLTPPNPCEPQAQGGYLGADNQLIRVQIVADPTQPTGTALVWGYDNASFLYRVTVGDDLQTLRLQSRPIDDFHKPQANQVVEVLRSSALLSSVTNDYIASATGFVATLETSYVSDTQSITLPAQVSLPPIYKDATQTPVAFLRVWQEKKPITPGQPITLTGTGLQITLQVDGTEPFHVGDYWHFAVRPATVADPQASSQVFPHRYLESPQVPEGPRMWVCPIAVITWDSWTPVTLPNGDCRNCFDNLVTLKNPECCGCYTVTIHPRDLSGQTTLQTIVDKAIARAKGKFVTIRMAPGTYTLTEPLQLTATYSNLTIESCHGGVIFQVEAGQEAQFRSGMITLNQTSNVTIRGLRFELPFAPFDTDSGATASSIAIRPVNAVTLTIEDCFFHFSSISNISERVYGLAIFCAGTCQGHTIKGNTFAREDPPDGTNFFGYIINVSYGGIAGDQTDTTGPDTLTNTILEDNLFTNLYCAIEVTAFLGNIQAKCNTVQNCQNGFFFLETNSQQSFPFVLAIANNTITVAPTDDQADNCALNVECDQSGFTNVLTVSTNVMQNLSSTTATVDISGFICSNVTGNTILNQFDVSSLVKKVKISAPAKLKNDVKSSLASIKLSATRFPTSLSITGVDETDPPVTVVTGNIYNVQNGLPVRSVTTSPLGSLEFLNNWDFLNTIKF